MATPECPRCGVIYAKARVAAPPADRAEEPAPPDVAMFVGRPDVAPSAWTGELDEARLELRVRTIAIPAALLLMFLALTMSLPQFLIRLGLSMWLHELGHATTAWLCGFPAFPGPWRTAIAEARSPFFTALLSGALIGAAIRNWIVEARGVTVGCAMAVGLVAVGTFGLSARTAQMLITFGGDGGGMVLGTLLMMTMYVNRDSDVHKGWLRWGFLVIGAAAFADPFSTWWAARKDFERIPFGDIEGVGLSDPSKLTDDYGWNPGDLIHRYVALGIACLVVLGIVYVVGVMRARAAVTAAERGE